MLEKVENQAKQQKKGNTRSKETKKNPNNQDLETTTRRLKSYFSKFWGKDTDLEYQDVVLS